MRCTGSAPFPPHPLSKVEKRWGPTQCYMGLCGHSLTRKEWACAHTCFHAGQELRGRAVHGLRPLFLSTVRYEDLSPDFVLSLWTGLFISSDRKKRFL